MFLNLTCLHLQHLKKILLESRYDIGNIKCVAIFDHIVQIVISEPASLGNLINISHEVPSGKCIQIDCCMCGITDGLVPAGSN